MCKRSTKSDCWKKKSNQRERGLIPWKVMHRELKKNYKEHFLFLEFSYICSLFLIANDESILHRENIQKRKMQNLLKIFSNNIFSGSHNPERAMFNFSLYELINVEKNLLCKDLHFSVKPGFIELLLPFELLFREIKLEDLCNEDMSLIKTRLLSIKSLNTCQKTRTSSFRN